MKRTSSPLLLLLLLISLVFNGYFVITRANSTADNGLAAATEVIDGDTFVLSTGERIRVLGVNAPENGRCYAEEAKEKLETLILKKPVRIEEERKDNFNRRMGLIYVDNRLINTVLIEEGYGKPDYTKNSHSDEFIAAYTQAKELKLGVNSELCKKTSVELPSDPNCTIKGNIDKATGDKFYHFPACKHYNQVVLDLDTEEGYFCTEEEAKKAGFVLAEGCEK